MKMICPYCGGNIDTTELKDVSVNYSSAQKVFNTVVLSCPLCGFEAEKQDWDKFPKLEKE